MRKGVDPVYENLVYLGRTFRPRIRRSTGFVDVAPLVDAALLVLIFFLIHSSFVVQPGVRLELPPAPFTDGAAYGSLIVTISQEGMVFFNDERTTLDGLGPAFERAVYEQPDTPLLIEADGRVRHASLMRIYNMAREAGVTDVYLATRAESASPPVDR